MKNKAFTLTELLVVVIIIGVLAMVVLPRFSGILETRKTAEAENIMRAVRTEQEARCTLDRNYTANAAELSSWPANVGHNYTYGLLASGIMATTANNRDASYTLYMDYGRGRICCDGADCDRLNKSYQNCDVEDADNPSAKTASNSVVAECAAHNAPAGCTPSIVSITCEQAGYPPGTSGSAELKRNADCSEEIIAHCGGTVTEVCTNGETRNETYNCGDKTWEVCVNKKWEHRESSGAEWTEEEKAECECDIVTPIEEPCDPAYPNGPKKTGKFRCNSSTGLHEPDGWDTSACGQSRRVWEEKTYGHGATMECVKLPGEADAMFGRPNVGGVTCSKELIRPIWDAWEVENNPKQPNCPAGAYPGAEVPDNYTGPSECIYSPAKYMRCAIFSADGTMITMGNYNNYEGPYYPGACYEWTALVISDGSGGGGITPGGRS